MTSDGDGESALGGGLSRDMVKEDGRGRERCGLGRVGG